MPNGTQFGITLSAELRLKSIAKLIHPFTIRRRHRGIVVALAVLAVLVAVAVDAAEPSCLVLVLVRPGVVLAMNGIQLDIASS